MPAVLDNSSIEYVLEGFGSDCTIFYYDSASSAFVNPTTIEPLRGYRIFVPSTKIIVNLENAGIPVGSMDVFVGPNLIGLTGYDSGSAEDALVLGGIDDSYEKILNWNPTKDPQMFDMYGYNCNVYPGPCPPEFGNSSHISTEDFPMEPLVGYWINVTSDDVYTGQG